MEEYLENNKDDLLIARLLTSDLSADEEISVIKKMESDKTFEKNIIDTGKMLNLVDAANAFNFFNEDKAIKKFLNKTKSSQQHAIKRYLIFGTSIAAMLLICLFVYFWKGNSIEKEIASNSELPVKDYKLSDGSSISLNINSVLSYDVNFNKNERKVTMKGEVYFDVKPDKTKPFIVKASGFDVTVVGTSFIIKSNEKDSIGKISVLRGTVIAESTTDTVVIKKGHVVTFSRNTGSFRTDSLHENNAHWATGILTFNDTPMNDVIAQIERTFNVKVIIADTVIYNDRLSATFERQEADTIIEMIGVALNLKVTKEKSTFILRKKVTQ